MRKNSKKESVALIVVNKNYGLERRIKRLTTFVAILALATAFTTLLIVSNK